MQKMQLHNILLFSKGGFNQYIAGTIGTYSYQYIYYIIEFT